MRQQPPGLGNDISAPSSKPKEDEPTKFKKSYVEKCITDGENLTFCQCSHDEVKIALGFDFMVKIANQTPAHPRMTKAQIRSAVSRKRKAGNPGGKPTNVSTFVKRKKKKTTRRRRR